MRKIFIVALLSIATIAGAQCPIKFKGVEITGKIQSFEKAMLKQGFTGTTAYPAYRGMQGQFGGEDVVLWVYASPKTETMRAVTVIYGFDPSRGMPLKDRYEMMKRRLIKKYGVPTEIDNKDYYCRWDFECGGVILKAHTAEQVGTAMGITYWDKTGEELNEAERSEDL